MADVREILTDSHVEIGVHAPGEVLDAEKADSGLRVLNRMIDQWAAEDITIYTVTRTLHSITANDGDYTIGSTGNISSIARPVFIDGVGLVDTNMDPDHEWPLHKLLEGEYRSIPEKARTNKYPDSWYYNPTFPNGTLYLFPVPSGTGLQVAIYHPTAISEFADVNATVSLPPGYREFLVTQVAVRLVSSFRVPLDPVLAQRSNEAKAIVAMANNRPAELQIERAAQIGNTGGGSYDIYLGR